MKHNDERDYAEEEANRAMVEEENTSEARDIRDLPIEETGIVEMQVRESPGRTEAGVNGYAYGWECKDCNGSTGLAFDTRSQAQTDLNRHVTEEHTITVTAVLDPDAPKTNGDADYSVNHGGV